MSLYTITSTPPRDRTLIGQLSDQLRLWKYQYEVTFGPYVLTPGEKLVLNTIVVGFLGLLIIGIICYLPPLLVRVGSRVFWLYNGSGDELVLNITASMWSDMAHDRIQ